MRAPLANGAGGASCCLLPAPSFGSEVEADCRAGGTHQGHEQFPQWLETWYTEEHRYRNCDPACAQQPQQPERDPLASVFLLLIEIMGARRVR